MSNSRARASTSISSITRRPMRHFQKENNISYRVEPSSMSNSSARASASISSITRRPMRHFQKEKNISYRVEPSSMSNSRARASTSISSITRRPMRHFQKEKNTVTESSRRRCRIPEQGHPHLSIHQTRLGRSRAPAALPSPR